MADFVAVLRKTIGALGENTPEMREKVYDKARATIEAKLAAINPPPPPAVVERQRKALEDAIAVVRGDYAQSNEADKDDGLEDVFASLKTMGQIPPPPKPAPAPAAPAPSAVPVQPAKSVAKEPAEPAAVASSSPAFDPAADLPDVDDDRESERLAALTEPRPRESRRRSLPFGGTTMIAALVLLLVLAGGSYAVWLNRDDFASLVGLDSGPGSPTEEGVVTTAEELVETAKAPDAELAVLSDEDQTPEEAAPEDEPEAEVAAAPAVEDTTDEPAEVEKFTQRLMPDGSEVDAGPAGGEQTIGEGTSIAAIAQPAEAPAGTAEESGTAATSETASEGGEQASEPSVAIAQRAIFYEERTTSAQGSAESGTIVWSLVQESPGGDLPPEPAIRAEANIPGKDVQFRMTIRRNGDPSLPASHIVEMIFLTPEDFEGGGISSVSRISFKETEQAAGNPLIGIPAKIADGFFLIALGDAPAEVEANTTLLRRRSWVDIPIVYQSGRRALLSLEKGIPGDRVFEQALQAWSEASSG